DIPEPLLFGTAHVLYLVQGLPVITHPVIIDGTTEPDYATFSRPVICLDGRDSGPADGLVLAGGNSTVRGLNIRRFDGNGIGVHSSGNVLQGNYSGTNVDGAYTFPNTLHGIVIHLNQRHNVIGGDTPPERNVISGNGLDGIRRHDNTQANTIAGNYIGLDATGAIDLGNSGNGVAIGNGHDNTVGGASEGERNVIAGNQLDGVRIGGPTATGNQIA